MDIFYIYKKYKKEQKKERSLVLLYTMQEINLRINNAEIDAGFMKTYKFYKGLFFIINMVIPAVGFGVATGVICSVIDSFVEKIKDVYLLTFSNLLFMSIGVFGVIITYLISCKHTLLFILLPYTIERMEQKIAEFNDAFVVCQAQTTQKAKVKRKRR